MFCLCSLHTQHSEGNHISLFLQLFSRGERQRTCSPGDGSWCYWGMWWVWRLGWHWHVDHWNGNPLQHSCPENSMDGGAWRAAVHGVAKSRTWLSDFTFFLSLSKKAFYGYWSSYVAFLSFLMCTSILLPGKRGFPWPWGCWRFIWWKSLHN